MDRPQLLAIHWSNLTNTSQTYIYGRGKTYGFYSLHGTQLHFAPASRPQCSLCDMPLWMLGASQVTSVLGDTVTDVIQSFSGGNGAAQFPAPVTAPAPAPASVPVYITASGDPIIEVGGRRLLHA